jgi:predicted SAM-dependent methyltransferase
MSEALLSYLEARRGTRVKLHLGCGGVRWKDFVNVDLYPADPERADSSRSGCVADVFADVRALALPEGYIDEIFSSHTLEHFPRYIALEMLRDWHRMLKRGGTMVIEMPDFVRCVLWLLHPNPKKRLAAKNQFYGNQWDGLDFETHRYVWSASEFKRELLAMGFSKVHVTHRTETHYRGRDMRITATK